MGRAGGAQRHEESGPGRGGVGAAGGWYSQLHGFRRSRRAVPLVDGEQSRHSALTCEPEEVDVDFSVRDVQLLQAARNLCSRLKSRTHPVRELIV